MVSILVISPQTVFEPRIKHEAGLLLVSTAAPRMAEKLKPNRARIHYRSSPQHR